MEISAGTVKQLREKTGVGMMECKTALVEAKGDLAEAEKILRKKGLSAAAGKSGRATGEGAIAARIDPSGASAVLVEVNCETDFAARNADFQALLATVVDTAAAKGASTSGATPDAAALEALLDAAGLRVKIAEAVSKIGENMQFRRFVKFTRASDEGVLASYIHTGAKIGVLLEAEVRGGATPEVESHLRDVAMHIAAAAPRFVRRDEISDKHLADEKEIAREQAIKAGKPPQVVDKIVQGRMEKYFGETCLLEQAFVKDPDRTVKQLLGDGATVRRFARFVLGESV